MLSMDKQIMNEALDKICRVKDKHVFIEYPIFKFLANETTYDLITKIIYDAFKNVLKTNANFTIHLSLKSLTLNEVEKHYTYISRVCATFKNDFPDKLETCHIYNAPFIFSKIISILSIFIDKPTREKIKLVEK
jgi:hypothetical protein